MTTRGKTSTRGKTNTRGSTVSTGVERAAEPSSIDSVSARYATARARLAGAQKGNAAVPAYLRYVNRKAGGFLACVAFALRLTPTQVTGLSGLASAAGLVVLALAPSTIPAGFVVAGLLAIGYALDSADGQLARVRGGGTVAGEWLDHVVDIAKTVALHSCVLIAIYRHFDGSHGWLLVPLAFMLAQATHFFATMLRDALRMQAGLKRQPPSKHASFVSSLVLLPVDHGTLCWSLALLGWHDTFLGAYTALAAVAVLFAGRTLARTYRGLAALTHESPV
jgi:phosphatidylglycerophosphate synthase